MDDDVRSGWQQNQKQTWFCVAGWREEILMVNSVAVRRAKAFTNDVKS